MIIERGRGSLNHTGNKTWMHKILKKKIRKKYNTSESRVLKRVVVFIYGSFDDFQYVRLHKDELHDG